MLRLKRLQFAVGDGDERMGRGLCRYFRPGGLVQLNDPDPLFWILGYLSMAALSLAAFFGRRFLIPNIVAAIVFSIWFGTLASSLVGAPEEAFTSFKMKAERHEEPREAVGLGLCAAWAITLSIWSRRSLAEPRDDGAESLPPKTVETVE